MTGRGERDLAPGRRTAGTDSRADTVAVRARRDQNRRSAERDRLLRLPTRRPLLDRVETHLSQQPSRRDERAVRRASSPSARGNVRKSISWRGSPIPIG
jgi:hypothetical protein